MMYNKQACVRQLMDGRHTSLHGSRDISQEKHLTPSTPNHWNSQHNATLTSPNLKPSCFPDFLASIRYLGKQEGPKVGTRHETHHREEQTSQSKHQPNTWTRSDKQAKPYQGLLTAPDRILACASTQHLHNTAQHNASRRVASRRVSQTRKPIWVPACLEHYKHGKP